MLPILFIILSFQKSPIIGMLSKPFYEEYNISSTYNYVIESQYVRFITQAGGRVVPIRHDLSDTDLEALLNQLDGALLPGGGSEIRTFDANNAPIGYTTLGKTGKAIVDYSIKAKKSGVQFPIWGTCLGFEIIGIAFTNNLAILSECPNKDCSTMNAIVNITKTTGPLIDSLSSTTQYAIQTEKITVNNHMWMISESDFLHSNLSDNFFLSGTSPSISGIYTFVSIFEGSMFPIYGVQFHPELHNLKIWEHAKFVPHNITSIEFGESLANFMVEQCRKSTHKMSDSDYEKHSIYLASTYYTSDTYQLYVFN